MNLEKYLEEILCCPNHFVDEIYLDSKVHKLRRDYGIRDSWPILLKDNKENFILHMVKNNFHIYNKNKLVTNLFFNPGTVMLTIGNAPFKIASYPLQEKIPFVKELKDLHLGVQLNTYQEVMGGKENAFHPEEVVLARAINIVGRYVLQQKIKSYFPLARNKGIEEYSKGILYVPERDFKITLS